MDSRLPDTGYASAGDVSIAYQVFGQGPRDLVVVPGMVSHVEFFHELPGYTGFVQRLAGFARVVTFDKRGQGLSDGITGTPSLEERMDDLRAVMDALDIRRPALLGLSEGGSMAALFTATYPDAVQALVLCGAFARFNPTADYPHGRDLETMLRTADYWGSGTSIRLFAPSHAADPSLTALWGKGEKLCTTPRGLRRMLETNARIDIRPILPMLRVPTLVLHRTGDLAVPIGHGRYLAEHIPGARLVELPGDDHAVFIGDSHAVTAAVEEFLTGSVGSESGYDTVLATVLFMDLVDSSGAMARLGDHRWRELLDAHDRTVQAQVAAHRGRLVKGTGDGFLATFDGPSRGVLCARAIRDRLRPLGLQCRAGLHVGEVELRGDDIAGIAVNIAARVMARAAPDEILVTRTLTDLVPGANLGFDDAGSRTLRGIPGTWSLLRLAP